MNAESGAYRGETAQAPGPASIYDRVGFFGTASIVWRAIPLLARPVVFPYALAVYKGLMERSENARELQTFHTQTFEPSAWYRPRFRKVREMLEEEYDIQW
jgi:hypothetical protein